MSTDSSMGDVLNLLDKLYVDLVTGGIDSDKAKDKLIMVYEQMLKINVSVIKNSVGTEDFAGKIISYYCDLCHATAGFFNYFRENNNGKIISKDAVVYNINDKVDKLYERISILESEIYQRDLNIEKLEDDIEDRDNEILNRFVGEGGREKLKQFIGSWKMENRRLREQLEYRDKIIEVYKDEFDKKEQAVKKPVDCPPAKRIDVSDKTVIQMYQSGMSPNKIAKTFNMTQSAIIYRLTKCGVYVKNGRNPAVLKRLNNKEEI